jgi:hypothetical protein
MENVLIEELHQIWNKYESQRAAELDAARVREEATRELAEMNAKRSKLGLIAVVEYQASQQLQAGNYWVGPQPKTWRDEMDAELLSAVKRFLG